MDESRSESNERPSRPAPDLSESWQGLNASSRAGLKAARDAAKALRILISADISLARSAFGRMLAFTGVAIAFGGSTWMLLMALSTALLHDSLGWSWTLSLGVCAGVSLLITLAGCWLAIHYFEHTRMKATRRQLARLGIGELKGFVPKPGSPESTREAAKDLPTGPGGEPPKKDLGVDVTPP